MKKLFLLIGLVVFSGSVFGAKLQWEIELEQGGYYKGDPSQNEILESNENYIIIRNKSALANIYINYFEEEIAAQVFYEEAKSHCSKNDFFTRSFFRHSTSLDNHTAYYYCMQEVGELLDDSYEATMLGICLGLSKNDSDYKEYKCKNYIKKGLKKWPQAQKYHDKISAHNNKFNNSSFIFNLKKQVLAKANTQQTIDDQQKKMETCEAYGFEKGSEPFGQCIFKLMELDLEYAKLENERLRLEAQAQQAKLNNQVALSQSLAAQAQASNRDKALRIQQFGLAMQGIANAFQTPSSMVNPSITCNQFGTQFRCW